MERKLFLFLLLFSILAPVTLSTTALLTPAYADGVGPEKTTRQGR